MNQLTSSVYVELSARDWPELNRQVMSAIKDYWHAHAGHWQPATICLQVSTKLLPDTLYAAQRMRHLPVLVDWLKGQGQAITVVADPALVKHRLILNAPAKSRR
jgi:hypothetical protein